MQQQRRQRISPSLIAVVVNASYTSIAPILPLEISKSGINERFISLIFLSFSLGSSLIPPLVAHRFQSIGTVKIMICSMIGMSIVFLFIGHVFVIARWISSDTSDDGDSSNTVQSNQNNNKLIIVSMLTILQFFLGAFFSIITTGYYALATILFTDEKESNIMSYIEASVGTGYIIGPLVGSYIYDTMGYQYTFSTFISLSMMLLAFVTWRFLTPCLRYKESEDVDDSGCFVESDDVEAQIVSDPSSSLSLRHTASYNSIDTSSEKKDSNNILHSINIEEEEKQTQQGPPPTISSLLRVSKIILAASAISMVNLSWTSIEPLLATRLDNTFHIGSKQIGLIFSLSNIIYVPTVFLVQYLPKHVRTLSISIMLTPIAVLLVGSNSLSMVVIGVILLGLLPTPCWIQLLPWMQEQTSKLYPDQPKANDITASIYNSAMTSGQVIGYVLGPLLGSKGFTQMTRIVALLITCQGTLFLFSTEKYCYKSSLRLNRRETFKSDKPLYKLAYI